MDRSASIVRKEGLAEARHLNLNLTPNQALLVVRYFAQARILAEAPDFATAEEKATEYSRRQPSVATYIVSPDPKHGVRRAVRGELEWLPE